MLNRCCSGNRSRSRPKKWRPIVSFGTAILGAFLGRKAVSAGSATRFGTAVKSAGSNAERKYGRRPGPRRRPQRLNMKWPSSMIACRVISSSLDTTFDPAGEELEAVTVKPQSTNITLKVFSLIWMPFRKDAGGRLTPDWQ